MYHTIEFMAVVASAIYGVLLANRHKMDFVGVFCLAFIVALGGGTLRDVLLDRHPLFWIQAHHYPVVVFCLALGTSIAPKFTAKSERFLSLPDALGLGLFSVAGSNAALECGTSWFIASLLGAVTGTFGGVMGDVICNRVPSLFRPAPMFATCSFAGAWVFILMSQFPATQDFSAPTAIVFVVAFRLAAIRYQWTLPHWEQDEAKGLEDSVDAP